MRVRVLTLFKVFFQYVLTYENNGKIAFLDVYTA